MWFICIFFTFVSTDILKCYALPPYPRNEDEPTCPLMDERACDDRPDLSPKRADDPKFPIAMDDPRDKVYRPCYGKEGCPHKMKRRLPFETDFVEFIDYHEPRHACKGPFIRVKRSAGPLLTKLAGCSGTNAEDDYGDFSEI